MQEMINQELPVTDTVDVSIVIVSWNIAELLAKCIQSILANSSGLSLQVFVVDNASTDCTVKMLHDRFPWVHIIANGKNLGFSRANNQAFGQVTGRFVLILNPDTVLVEGALKEMINFMASHPEAGMVGPCLFYPNGEIQKTCARLLPTLASSLYCNALHLFKLPLIGSWFSKKYISPYNYHVSQEVEAISGAAMLVRGEVIKAIGGFGESFIHCGEDVDFCFRVRKAGWKIYYFCDSVVIHFAGRSRQQARVRTFVNAALSVQEYFNRCFGIGQGLLYRFILQVIQVPLMIAVGCAKTLLGLGSVQEFKRRLQIAKAIWLWRALE